MPPKKDDKKGKKGGNYEPKVINFADYKRTAVTPREWAGDIPVPVSSSGSIINIDTLFPEWDVSTEDWTVGISIDDEIAKGLKYPNHIKYQELKTLKNFLQLDNLAQTIDPKAAKGAKKEAPKKGAAPSANEFEEPVKDDAGNLLPRMYVGSNINGEGVVDENEFKRNRIYNSFTKEWSRSQEILLQELREESDFLAAAADSQSITTSESDPQQAASLAASEKLKDMLRSEPPSGHFRDPLMCSAFSLIQRFTATSKDNCIDNNTEQNNGFLWEAIWPKLPSGRPCYNPAGKYCVRLFVGGKWRKVVVSDNIPITKNGVPAIASSVVLNELWPIILAKAVYAVYSACGYSESLPDFGLLPANVGLDNHELETTNLPKNDLLNSKNAVRFVSFALHVMTGWVPSSPWQMAEVVHDDSDRMMLLLEEIITGGAVNMPFGEIPIENPVTAERKRLEDVAEVARAMKTKKEFRSQYTNEEALMTELVSVVNDREDKIAKLSNALKNNVSEAFMIAIPIASEALGFGYRLLPILAIASDIFSHGVEMKIDKKDYDVNTLSNDSKMQKLKDVRILVDWSVGPLSDPGMGADVPVVSFNGELTTDYPPASTLLIQEWITIRDLCDMGAYAIGLDTLSKRPFQASMGWHWLSEAALTAGKAATSTAPPDAKGKAGGKDSKKNEVVADSSKSNVDVVMDPGITPPMLLKVNIPENLDSSSSNSNSAELDASVTSNLQMITLSVMVHADLLKSSINAQDLNKVISNKSDEIEENSSTTADGETILSYFSEDIVVVLQELRFGTVATTANKTSDLKDPILMRVQLRKSSPLPIARVTFRIPVESYRTEPFIFQIRLLSQSSCFLQFFSDTNISVTEADVLWKEIKSANATSLAASEKYSITREGETSAVRKGTEQLLFRIPLVLSKINPSSSSSSSSSLSSPLSIDAESFPVHRLSKAIAFIHISNRDIARQLSVVIQENKSMVTRTLPISIAKGGFCVIPLSDENETILIARAFSSINDIAAFKWKVIILSDIPMIDPVIQTIESPVVKYTGYFTPNNKLLLFKDIISVDKVHFPLAFRFSVADNYLSTTSSLSLYNPIEELHFSVKLIRKSDNITIGEYKFRGLGQLYYLTADMFVSSSEIESQAASSTAGNNAKKDTKKDAAPAAAKGGKAAATTAGTTTIGPPFPGGGTIIDFIIECKLDEEAMTVPLEWKSRYPFKFDAGKSIEVNTSINVDSTADVTASKNSHILPRIFSWNYDIIGGYVTDVTHDTQDLQKYATMKNSWEEKSEGRAERAAAAASYWNDKKTMLSTPNDAMPTPSAAMLASLSIALEKEVDFIQEREKIILASPQYKEYVETRSKDAVLLNDEEKAIFEERHKTESSVYDNSAEEIHQLFINLSNMVKANATSNVEALLYSSNQYMEECKLNWLAREKYRSFAEAKNSSLKYLIQRATEAVEATAEGDDASKKKGGKPKKK